MLRIVSWNANGLDVWDSISRSGVDVALLQEARRPPRTWPGTVAPDPEGDWRTAGWRSEAWSRRTAVVQVSDSFPVVPRALTDLETYEPGALAVSRHGTLAAADVVVGGETVTLVSL